MSADLELDEACVSAEWQSLVDTVRALPLARQSRVWSTLGQLLRTFREQVTIPHQRGTAGQSTGETS